MRDVAGVKFYARAVTGVDMKDLKSLADEAKQSVGSGVVAIAATAEDGKASLVVAVTPDQTSRFNAVDLVRARLRRARRQGRRRPAGHGSGGRPGRRQRGQGADRGRGGDSRPSVTPFGRQAPGHEDDLKRDG